MAEHSHTTVQIVKVDYKDLPPTMVIQIGIDCPICGVLRFQIVGHHAKVIRDACIDAIDRYPELSGGETTIVAQHSILGPGNDPSTS